MAQEIPQEPLNEKDEVTFVISNRRSGFHSKDPVKRSRYTFDASFASVLEADAKVLKDIAPPEEDSRRVVAACAHGSSDPSVLAAEP
jgi:hypothetical protein